MSEQEWAECQELAKMLSYLREIMQRKHNVVWRLAFKLLGGGWSVTEKKVRAFLLGSFEALARRCTDARSREALEVYERLADGRARARDFRPFETAMAAMSNEAWGAAMNAADALWQESRRVTEEAVSEGDVDAAAWHDWANLVEESHPAFPPYPPPEATRWEATLSERPCVRAAREASQAAWQDWRVREALRYMMSSRTEDALQAAHQLASYRANELAIHLEERKAWCEAERTLCDFIRDVIGDPWEHRPHAPVWVRNLPPRVRSMGQAIYEERRLGDLPILADALEEAGCTDTKVLAHCRQPGRHVRGCWALNLILGKS